jgi:hypothetical protein
MHCRLEFHMVYAVPLHVNGLVDCWIRLLSRSALAFHSVPACRETTLDKVGYSLARTVLQEMPLGMQVSTFLHTLLEHNGLLFHSKSLRRRNLIFGDPARRGGINWKNVLVHVAPLTSKAKESALSFDSFQPR